MKIVRLNDVQNWLLQSGTLSEFTHSIGQRQTDAEYIEQNLHLPAHLQFVIEQLTAESAADVPADAFDSLPFYSLCKGLFLPLSYLTAERAAQIFGIRTNAPPDTAGREKLLAEFIAKDVGLTLVEKIGCVLGDVFLGQKSTLRRDSLLRLLQSLQM